MPTRKTRVCAERLRRSISKSPFVILAQIAIH